MVLYRLLRDMPAEDYVVFSRQKYDGNAGSSTEPSASSRLPGRYVHLPRHPYFREWGPRALQRVLSMTNNSLRAASQIRRLAGVAKEERLSSLIACTGDLADLPVGYAAARLAGIPFGIYLFDDYLHQWSQPRHVWFARCAEPVMVKSAKVVIVPNEFLRDAYRRRYGVEAAIVRNPCEAEIGDASATPWPAQEGEIRIVYTGAVYHVNYDAIRNLVAALRLLNDVRIKLHLYTSYADDVLRREGIVGPVVRHEHVPVSEAIEIQRRADILFLPLTFHGPIHETLRTAAPGKMGEYLAAGRPILTHTPSDSFVTWYFRTNGCGAVVDRMDPAELAAAIRRIIDDATARAQWRERAQACARAEFLPHVAAAAFLRAIQ
jgi:glycosyltransferase involved in cell wall biosynthesis